MFHDAAASHGVTDAGRLSADSRPMVERGGSLDSESMPLIDDAVERRFDAEICKFRDTKKSKNMSD